MGVVGSLPSPPPRPATPITNIEIVKEEPIPMNDECTYRIVNIADIDFHPIKSPVVDEIRTETCSDKREENAATMSYSSARVRTRRSQAPTLETGRRSKFLKLEGEEAAKRELRRKRNRDAAKKIKEKRFFIEQQLEKDIEELESKEKELTSKVKNLEIYKVELQHRYEQIVYMQEKLSKTISSTRRPLHRPNQQVKEEARSPSPQWQLLFSI